MLIEPTVITWPTPPGGVRDAKGGGAGTSRAGQAGGLVDDTLIEVTAAPGRLPGGRPTPARCRTRSPSGRSPGS
ncbi:hypothetical protein ACFQ2B_01955 [Streptomyces stramineus]